MPPLHPGSDHPFLQLAVSSRHLAYALALSILLHALLLWLPELHFAQDPISVPPLSVRLEPLHETDMPPAPTAAADPISLPSPKAAEELAAEAAGATQKVEKPATPQLFPKRMQLSFAVQGIHGRSEMQQQLDISGDKYALQSLQRSSGPASLTGGVQITRISRGHIDEHGLRPDSYEEERLEGDARKNITASFDWKTQRINFSHGSTIELPASTQDVLSLTYQMGLLNLRGETVPMSSSDGEILEQYELEISRDDALSTPMGELRTLRLRKIHQAGESYFEIWLARDYRLLPVKLRRVSVSGETLEEQTISAIRITDE